MAMVPRKGLIRLDLNGIRGFEEREDLFPLPFRAVATKASKARAGRPAATSAQAGARIEDARGQLAENHLAPSGHAPPHQ